MSSTAFDPASLLRSALSGTGVHINPVQVLDDIEWEVAGSKPSGSPHSIFQIVNHLAFWQELFLSGLTESQMSAPATAADGWPGSEAPSSADDWTTARDRFLKGHDAVLAAIESADPLSGIPAHEPTKRANVINTIAVHTSYHLGQIVMLRRQLGA